MKTLLLFIFSIVPAVLFAHESSKSFFKIEQKETTVEVIAEFPWTIRNALLEFAPELKTSKSKTEFDDGFFDYVKSAFIITDSSGKQLELLSVSSTATDGHTHQNDFLFVFKGNSFDKIENSILFNLKNNQVNYNSVKNGYETRMFETSKNHSSFTLNKKQNAALGYLWLLILSPIVIGIGFKIKPSGKKNNYVKHSIYFSFLFILIACNNKDVTFAEASNQENTTEETTNSKPNILLIIADDMGLDATPGYDIGTLKPSMPTLTSLMDAGIKFNNVWSNPTCTPTRGTIITGKYGYRTGVTKVDDVMPTSETSLQTYITSNGASEYETAVIGKWHLGRSPNHPNNMGVDYYAGFLGGGVQSYWNWPLTINGTQTTSTEYTTTKFTDLAIDWIGAQTRPWFLWMAYNAPHTPFHLPPNNLHSQGNLPSDDASIVANPLPYYLAMIEAMDTEMGRLITSMSQYERDNTVIIFIGDNGTPNQVVQEYGSRRAKGTIYQGGVNVPMVVSGKNVTRINDTDNSLINTTDLFSTIANIAGVGASEINDSKSFYDVLTIENPNERVYTFAQNVKPSGNSDYAIRNETHKYIEFANGTKALYNLSEAPLENPNLMDSTLSDSDAVTKTILATKLSDLLN